MLLGQVDDFSEGSLVAIHAEQRFRDNELSTRRWRILQACLELIQIAMTVDGDLCAREPAAVDNARVIEDVAQNNIAIAHQCRKNSRVRLESGIENQRRFGSLKLGDLALQLFVQGHVARDQPRRAGAAAVAVDRLFRCRAERGMVGDAKVVVGGKVQNLLAVHGNNRALFSFNQSEATIKGGSLEALEIVFDKTCGP